MRSRLVVPVWPKGVPATIRMRPPGGAMPKSTAISTASSVMESRLSGWPATRASRPHTRARRWATAMLGVRASTGCSGRSRARRRAAPPVRVKATRQLVERLSAARLAAAITMSASWSSSGPCSACISSGQCGSCSTRSAMRFIIVTASSG